MDLHRKVLEYLRNESSTSIKLAALRCLINLSTGDEMQQSVLVNLKILDDLQSLIMSRDNRIRKEVYHILSNLFVSGQFVTR
jgi:hypothetical protein